MADTPKKVGGVKLCEFEGLQLFGTVQRAKHKGRDRIWIQIRQNKPKKWHVSTTLSYAQALDVQFQGEKGQ